MEYIFCFLGTLVTFAIGYLTGRSIQIKAKTYGWLLIDKKRDRFKLELNNVLDLDNLPKSKTYLVLHVDPTADLPPRKENSLLNEMEDLK